MNWREIGGDLIRRFVFLLAGIILLLFVWLSPIMCLKAPRPMTMSDAFIGWCFLAIFCLSVALLPDDEADKEIEYYSSHFDR